MSIKADRKLKMKSCKQNKRLTLRQATEMMHEVQTSCWVIGAFEVAFAYEQRAPTISETLDYGRCGYGCLLGRSSWGHVHIPICALSPQADASGNQEALVVDSVKTEQTSIEMKETTIYAIFLAFYPSVPFNIPWHLVAQEEAKVSHRTFTSIGW